MVIYLTTNLVNGKMYVGKDSKNRSWYLGSGKYLKKAIKKYGKDNFKKEILQECNTLDELNKAELDWISRLDCKKDPNYYNMIDTLTPNRFGTKLTDQHKSKISKSHIGIVHTDETREKMSNSQKIRKRFPHSSECVEKIRKSNTGKKRTLETKEKLSRLKKGVPNVLKRKKIAKLEVESKKILKSYNKINDVEKDGFSRTAVLNVLKGRSNTSGGFFWKYL